MREPDDWIEQNTILTPFLCNHVTVSTEDERHVIEMQTMQDIFDLVMMITDSLWGLVDVIMVIITYLFTAILGYDVCKAAISYANPTHSEIKFPIISRHPQLIIFSGALYFNLFCLIGENAPFHSYSTAIIFSIIIICIFIIVVSYLCFIIKQKNYIKSSPLIPKSFSIAILNPILISLLIISTGYSLMSTCEQIVHKPGNIQINPNVEYSINQIPENNPMPQQSSSYTNSRNTNTTNTQNSGYQTANYQKENDFMVAVLNNPQFNLYDFITVDGLHERNTQFLTEAQYWNTKYIKNKCAEMGINDFHSIYNKVKTAWSIFKEIQDTDVSYDGMGKYFYNYGAWDVMKPSNCPYPELKHKLSIVPLQLK